MNRQRLTLVLAAVLAATAALVAWQRGPGAAREHERAYEADLTFARSWTHDLPEAPLTPGSLDEERAQSALAVWRRLALGGSGSGAALPARTEQAVEALVREAFALVWLRLTPDLSHEQWFAEMERRGYRRATAEEIVRENAADATWTELTGSPLPTHPTVAALAPRYWIADASKPRPISIVSGADGIAIGHRANAPTRYDRPQVLVDAPFDFIWTARASKGGTLWYRPPSRVTASGPPFEFGVVGFMVRYSDGVVRPLRTEWWRTPESGRWYLSGVHVGIWDPARHDLGGLEW